MKQQQQQPSKDYWMKYMYKTPSALNAICFSHWTSAAMQADQTDKNTPEGRLLDSTWPDGQRVQSLPCRMHAACWHIIRVSQSADSRLQPARKQTFLCWVTGYATPAYTSTWVVSDRPSRVQANGSSGYCAQVTLLARGSGSPLVEKNWDPVHIAMENATKPLKYSGMVIRRITSQTVDCSSATWANATPPQKKKNNMLATIQLSVEVLFGSRYYQIEATFPRIRTVVWGCWAHKALKSLWSLNQSSPNDPTRR